MKNATALVGELLKIHPMVKMIDGYLVADKKYRGSIITTHGGTGCFGLSGFGKKTS